MRATMPGPVLALRFRLGDNINLAVCSTDCAARWQLATFLQRHGAVLDATPVTPTGSCTACCWCGTTVSVPVGECRLHGEDCPAFDWTATECGRRAVVEVAAVTGCADLPPRCFGYFDKVAAALAETGRFPDRQALVEGVLGVRVDWLP